MKIFWEDSAKNELSKLDNQVKKRIIKYLDEVEKLDNPRNRGKILKGNLSNLWRYRVGDYRIISSIDDEKIIIVVLKISHRRDVYKIEK